MRRLRKKVKGRDLLFKFKNTVLYLMHQYQKEPMNRISLVEKVKLQINLERNRKRRLFMDFSNLRRETKPKVEINFKPD